MSESKKDVGCSDTYLENLFAIGHRLRYHPRCGKMCRFTIIQPETGAYSKLELCNMLTTLFMISSFSSGTFSQRLKALVS